MMQGKMAKPCRLDEDDMRIEQFRSGHEDMWLPKLMFDECFLDHDGVWDGLILRMMVSDSQ
jgi:hypothetical protein